MKKVAAVFFGITAPLSSLFAAFNDVTVTTSASLLVGGIQVSITGTSATIESITVTSGSFTVGMQSGSSITITVPGGNQPSASTDSDVTQTCTTSSLTLTATGAASIVVTPTGGTCTAASSTSGGSSSGGGVVPPEYLGNKVCTDPKAQNYQVYTIYSSGECLYADGRIGTITPATNTGEIVSKFIFTRNLRLNMKHADILQLQRFLNAQGFKVALNGAGSPGNETDRFGRLTYNALIKFQEAHAIEILKPSGLKKGTGYFGPSTRAFVNK